MLQFQKSLATFAVSVTTLLATMVVFGSPHSLRMMSLLTTGHLTDRRLHILTDPLLDLQWETCVLVERREAEEPDGRIWHGA